MAAVIVGVVAVVVVVASAMLMAWQADVRVVRAERRAERAEERVYELLTSQAPPDLAGEVFARLLENGLPKVNPVTRDEAPESDAEYEADVDEVPDWTDALDGLHPAREMVGGLRVGDAIPGIGEMAADWPGGVEPPAGYFDEADARADEARYSWVEPIDLGDGEMVE